MPRHLLGPVLAVALVLTAGVTACGQQQAPDASSATALQDCRDQWGDVAESVVGLDADTNPSALASRWNTVIATVEYYQNTDTDKDCQTNIENQVKANSALRQFSEKLRPYDMEYQLSRVTAAADLYVHDPLPKAVRNDNGKLVKPPAKAAVAAALRTLTTDAVAANAELQPAWGQLASVELTDTSAVTTTLRDLDSLAQDSPAWSRCEQALQVLVTAITVQEGASG